MCGQTEMTMWRLSKKVVVCKPRRQTSGETNPADTLTLNFQTPELREINFYCLSHPVCSTLLWLPWQANICIHMCVCVYIYKHIWTYIHKTHIHTHTFILYWDVIHSLRYTNQWFIVYSQSCLCSHTSNSRTFTSPPKYIFFRTKINEKWRFFTNFPNSVFG